jgi:O-antigen/teichoic acid export membrane protein
MYAMSAERLRPFRDTMWSASRLRVVAVSYRKFPLVSAPSQTLNGIALALPVPLVATYFGIIPAGQYAVATRIMILPMSLIGMSVSDVFHQRIADMSRTNPERAVRFLLRALLSLFVLALVPALIVTIGGEELFVFVLGPDWRLAGSIAAAVVPWVVAQFSVSPLSRIAVVYQGQESQLFYNLLHIANIVGVMAYGNAQGWSLIRICTVLSWAQAGIYGVYFLMLLGVVHKNLLINLQQGAGPGEDPDDV